MEKYNKKSVLQFFTIATVITVILCALLISRSYSAPPQEATPVRAGVTVKIGSVTHIYQPLTDVGWSHSMKAMVGDTVVFYADSEDWDLMLDGTTAVVADPCNHDWYEGAQFKVRSTTHSREITTQDFGNDIEIELQVTDQATVEDDQNDPVVGRTTITPIKVVIKMDEQDITNDTQDTIVGKKISLVGETLPEGMNITKHQWTIPGIRIKNYEADDDEGKVIQLEEDDLDDETVEFYWVDGGDDREVKYSVTIEGKVHTVKTTFDVKRPTATITAVTGAVGFGWVGDFPALPALGFFGPGISFSHDIDIPEGFNGETCWVQVITNTLNRIKLVDQTWLRLEAEGVLDTDFPYSIDPEAIDSPHCILTGLIEAILATDFRMWLMFKPAGEGNIWVPLRSVDWSWEATASRDGNTWTLDSSDHTTDPEDADTINHPEWEGNIKDCELVEE